MPDRPGEIDGFQPEGRRLGAPGPDQGYALRLATRLRPKLRVQTGEHVDDAIRGCLGAALRRASMFGRAPIMADVTVAFTIWGFFDPDPPADLVAFRGPYFEGLRHVIHAYSEARVVADMVPDATLRMTPTEVADAYPDNWRALVGA